MRKRLHATKGDICVILPGFCVISPLKLCQRTSSPDARIIGVKVCINHKFAIKHQTAVIDSWQRKQISAFTLTMTLWGVAGRLPPPQVLPMNSHCPVYLYVRARVNKIEATYGRSGVNVKVERDSPFTLHATFCLYFIYARKRYVLTYVKITRQWKSTLWEVARKRKSWTLLNFYVYARLFIHRLYFILELKFYARRWISTVASFLRA